jgi:hypothetical protein
MSYAMQLARNNANMVKSRGVGLMSRSAGATAGMIGRVAMHPVAGMGIFSAVGAAMTYDPTKSSIGSHFAREGLATGVDSAFDLGLFAAGSLFGGVGAVAAIGTSVALSYMGMNPGRLVQHSLEEANKRYRDSKGMGRKSIMQNERTMRATNTALSMLGQTRRPGMLGQEASFMHN